MHRLVLLLLLAGCAAPVPPPASPVAVRMGTVVAVRPVPPAAPARGVILSAVHAADGAPGTEVVVLPDGAVTPLSLMGDRERVGDRVEIRQ